MRKYPLIVKGLAVGIILLFIGTAIIPSINANITDQSIQERLPQATPKTIKVIRCEYKSDGSIEKKILEVPQDEFSKFQDEFHFAQTIEQKLDLYKKYDLVPQNVSMDSIRKNFDDYTKKVNNSKALIDDYAQKFMKVKHLKNGYFLQFVMNLMSTVNGNNYLTLRFDLGLSPAIGRINALLFLLRHWYPNYYQGFPSADLLILQITAGGVIYTNGLLGEQDYSGNHGLYSFSPLFFCLEGFVGYMLIFPIFLLSMTFFLGFSMLVFGVGAK